MEVFLEMEMLQMTFYQFLFVKALRCFNESQIQNLGYFYISLEVDEILLKTAVEYCIDCKQREGSLREKKLCFNTAFEEDTCTQNFNMHLISKESNQINLSQHQHFSAKGYKEIHQHQTSGSSKLEYNLLVVSLLEKDEPKITTIALCFALVFILRLQFQQLFLFFLLLHLSRQ